MQILLPDNHPSIMHSYEVDNLLRTYFPGSPLTLFNFGKVHQDGSISFITNNAELSISFLKANVRKAHSSKSPELLDKNNYWHLWEHHLLDFPFDMTRQFNVSNGLTFVERHHDCYYMTAFGLNNNFQGAIDYYFSIFENLRNFIRYFRETKTNLIDTLEHNKICLPSEAQDPNKEILILDKSKKARIPFIYNNYTSHMTAQEFECIKRLPSGKTAKNIALELGISHRTVEGYLNRVMLRSGCKNKRELISLLNHIEYF